MTQSTRTPRELFAELRARFQTPQPDLKMPGSNYHQHITHRFDELCHWLEHDLDVDAEPEFAQLATEYLNQELDAKLLPYNRVLNQDLFIHSKLPIVESLMRGVHVIFRRDTITKAYLKQLENRYKAMASREHLQTLNVDCIEQRNARNLFKVLGKYQGDSMIHFAFGVGEMTARKPAQVEEVMAIVFEALPEQLQLIAFQSNFTNNQTADKINEAFISGLPGFTKLEVFSSRQWIDDASTLERLLDALPSSVTSLSLSLYMNAHFDAVVEIFQTHPIMQQLERLRLGFIGAEHFEKLEALSSIQSLEAYYLAWPRRNSRLYPTLSPWHDVKEETRQAMQKSKAGEQVGLSAEQLGVESMSHRGIEPDALRALLFARPDTPNVFRVLKRFFGTELSAESMSLVMAHGSVCFPLVESLAMSLAEDARCHTPQDVSLGQNSWERLEILHLDVKKSSAAEALSSMMHTWSGETPVEEIFPRVNHFRTSAHVSVIQAFLVFWKAHLPALETLTISHGDSDADMCDVFDVLHAANVWSTLGQLNFYVSDYIAASFHRGSSDGLLRRWIEHVKDDTVPAYLRRHILRALLSEHTTKAVLAELYADAFGVKVKKSARRDAQIASLVSVLPADVRDYKVV